MRGRKPEDAAIKLLQGTFRTDREAPEESNSPAVPLGPPPDWLKGKAKWAWKRFSVELAPRGHETVERRHREKLAMLCKTYALWRDAVAEIDAHGLTVILRNSNGDAINTCKNPAIVTAMATAKECRLLFSEFNAAAVAGKGAVQASDPLGELLKRRGPR